MVTIKQNIDIAPYTTFGVHAKVAALVVYDTVDDLRFILRDDLLPRPFKHIGAGSNMLFTTDFPGTLLLCRNKNLISIDKKDDTLLVTYPAGAQLDDVIQYWAEQEVWGLENLSGIPGTVGASVVQNVGAYGVEVGDLVECVQLLDCHTLDVMKVTGEWLQHGYRDSILKHEPERSRYIVLNVTYRLSRQPNPQLKYANLHQIIESNKGVISPIQVRDAIMAMRDAKLPDPKQIGSAGSFFKNPVISRSLFNTICEENIDVEVPRYELPDGTVKIPAAWLIDQCGFKGTTEGGAAVWHKQPLVIVNLTGAASAHDIVALESRIISAVSTRFHITLSPEVEHLP